MLQGAGPGPPHGVGAGPALPCRGALQQGGPGGLMRILSVHLPRGSGVAARPSRAPVLVREGFSWGAFLFALPWLLLHRMWLEAIGYLGLVLLLAAFVPEAAALPVALALQFLVGAEAQDLRRAALARRGRP